jgi:Xaa-Pro dipeptidase
MSGTRTVDGVAAARRLARARQATAAAGVHALLITPGPDLRYLLGTAAESHERLTCLVLPAVGPATVVVPRLERPGLAGSAVDVLELAVADWTDGQDPYALVGSLLRQAGGERATLAVSDGMPARHVLALRDALPAARQELAGPVVRELRMRKDAEEVDALRRAGAAIDRVHARMAELLRPGRTEAQVGADIADAIVAEGHARAAFVIVGSGPNGASPHHEVSDRVIRPGDLVVIDIGGPLADGYNSDCTRTYAIGEPPAEVRDTYEVLRAAQAAAVAAVAPGVPAERIDAAARTVIDDAGFGDRFIHRTGHGIGLEVHEEPYIVAGNSLPLEPGMAFSVEPGIYLPGRWGARIEDIVVVTEHGVRSCNERPHELAVL